MKKKVPHFRRIALYSEWGRSPEWGSPQNACILWGPRGGGGTTLPCQGTCTPIKLYLSRALVWAFLPYPKQMGTDLNPTENAFGGDPEKMSNEGHVLSLIGHLRPQAPPQVGDPGCSPSRKSRIFARGPRFTPSPIVPTRSCSGKEGVQRSHVRERKTPLNSFPHAHSFEDGSMSLFSTFTRFRQNARTDSCARGRRGV